MDCEWCDRIATDGWLGDSRISHCARCHATWKRATRSMHCVTCHRTFAAPSLCDQHQETGRCIDPAQLGMRTFVQNVPGATEVWRSINELEPAT